MNKKIAILIMVIILLTGCSNSKEKSNNLSKETSGSANNAQLDNNWKDKIDTSLIDNMDTTNSPFTKGYYDYSGYINNNLAIKMSIYPLDKDIVGSYVYDSKRIEIKLKGKASANDIVLYEYDDSGKNTGIYKGTMATIDKIEGTWSSPDGKQSYPFTLSLNSNITGAEYGKRYAVAGVKESDKVIENYASEIQGYITNNNKDELADKIKYPISVNFDGKLVNIQDKDNFLKNYDNIINANFKRSLSKAYTNYLFANWSGIMLGEDTYNIWINETDSKLMITNINNGDSVNNGLTDITEKTKNYIMNGQGNKPNAEKINWSKTFLDKVNIESVYNSYLKDGGKTDDLESFSLYLTKNAPIPSDWQDLFAKDLFDAFGYKIAKLEPLKDYPDYYQVYVIIDGIEKPYVVVSSRTGYFHG